MSMPGYSDILAEMSPSLFLVEEFTHRVLNEYTEAICSLSLAAAAAPDTRSIRAINAAAGLLHAHAEAHRALQVPLAEGSLELAAYLEGVCGRLAKAHLTTRGVRLTVCADEVWLKAVQCWRVGLIVAELVRNASRHGLRGGPGWIRVDVVAGHGQVVCCVRDNGRAVAGREGHGRGRRLVENLAAALDGALAWTHSPSGCCARVTFPVSQGECADPNCAHALAANLA
jgi:two-component sensor histidine kinase